jgi:hypothetical protein
MSDDFPAVADGLGSLNEYADDPAFNESFEQH